MTTYDELLKKYGYLETQAGVNEDGENVLISIDKICASITTLQNNGWSRVNIYYPDGASEEYYNK